MNSEKSTLVLTLVDVYSNGKCCPTIGVYEKYHLGLKEPEDGIDPDLLGSCKIFRATEKVTIGYLYTSFIPGHTFENNIFARKYVSNVGIDIDLRRYMQQDTQSSRDVNVRKALNDLKCQLDIHDYDKIVVNGLHCKQFEEKGSYFEILRKFFIIEHNRDFALHLKIGKKYPGFVDLAKINRKRITYGSLNNGKDVTSTSFDIREDAKNLD